MQLSSVVCGSLGDPSLLNRAVWGRLGTALPEAVQTQMWTPQPSIEENERQFQFTMTLGWFIVDMKNGRQFYGHNGHKLGFGASYMRFHDEEMSLILFVNTDMVNENHKLAVAIGERVKESI